MKQISELKERLLEQLPAYELFSEEPLSKHTSFRIGGPAELMVFPRSVKDLSQVIKTTHEMGIHPYILGGGTNVLAPDEGLRGVVIVTKDALIGLQLLDETHISAMSGMTLAKTAMFAAQDNLSGLEFAHGIPGTVGGAIYMNAGAYGGEIKDVAVKTEFMRLDGEIEVFEGEAQGFDYRSSAFQSRDGVILRTEFALTPSSEKDVRNRIKELADRRRASQPLELPSAGSTFKRPQTGYAAALIDEAGLKGLQVGGAAVAPPRLTIKPACFSDTAADVLALVKQVQSRVFDHSGVLLEPEIRLWKNED